MQMMAASVCGASPVFSNSAVYTRPGAVSYHKSVGSLVSTSRRWKKSSFISAQSSLSKAHGYDAAFSRSFGFENHGANDKKAGVCRLPSRKCYRAGPNGKADCQRQLATSLGASVLMYLLQARKSLACSVSLKDEISSNSSSSESAVTSLEAGKEVPTHLKPEPLNILNDADIEDVNGKPGFVSFYSGVKGELALTGIRHRSLLWLLGPFVLVASIVLPPYVFRTVFEALLEDTVVTDFIILFFTEAYFYIGVSAFLFIAHKFRGPALDSKDNSSAVNYTWGYRVCAAVCTALSVVLGTVCFCFSWKYTGPAAIAALVPYLGGLVIQYSAERFAEDKPAIRPLIPIIFQVYRLHQLNRAAQLVAGLIFSMKGVEASAQTTAITGSLQLILSSLQLLGIFSLWSLAAFLTQTTLAWHHVLWALAVFVNPETREYSMRKLVLQDAVPSVLHAGLTSLLFQVWQLSWFWSSVEEEQAVIWTDAVTGALQYILALVAATIGTPSETEGPSEDGEGERWNPSCWW